VEIDSNFKILIKRILPTIYPPSCSTKLHSFFESAELMYRWYTSWVKSQREEQKNWDHLNFMVCVAAAQKRNEEKHDGLWLNRFRRHGYFNHRTQNAIGNDG
jgi:hypothetical protein